MSNYEQLRSEINKRFPERLKLEFGCEWVTKHNNEVYVCLNGLRSTEVAFPKGLYLKDIFENDGVETLILGKPLELRDVLRAMKKIAPEKGDDFPIGFDYHGRISNCDVDCKNLTQTDIGLNLAGPLSHPDNDEACEKLLALLTNKGI